MFGHFDIDYAVEIVRQCEPNLQRGALSFTDGPVDVYGGTLVISGDCGPGSVIRGQGNVVVEGSVNGSARKPIQIDVDGNVVILQDVSHAVVNVGGLSVGANVFEIEVNARLGLEVGGNLSRARIQVGAYDLERLKIDQSRQRLTDSQRERDATERKLKMEEKRVDKLFKNTRAILGPNVGRILQAKRNRLTVNLEPIYASLAERDENDIDKALKEFFAKAIVGLLTRSNQHFLMSKNRHRQEIFKSIVRDVHDLFFLKRKFDKQSHLCATLAQDVDDAIQALDGRIARIFVRGACLPDIKFTHILPDVMVSDQGNVLMNGEQAHLQVSLASKDRLKMTCVSTLGLTSHKVIEMGQLQNCNFLIDEGDVVWKGVEACDVVVGV